MSLPVTVRQFVDVIGHTRAMALVREFGGQEITMPKNDTSQTWSALAEVIGEAATARLCAQYEYGRVLYIPKCAQALIQDRNRKIIAVHEKLLKDGHTNRGAVSVLVREYRLSYRQIENIVNRETPEPSGLAPQGKLF